MTEKQATLEFFDLKGVIESLAIGNVSFRRVDRPDFALATEILSGDRVIGFAGQLATTRAAEIDVPGSVFLAELQADPLLEGQKSAKVFREIERFPAVTRDIAMIVPDKLTHAEIVRKIEELREPLLESVELFDLFEDRDEPAPGASGKSLAYRLTYRDKNRTLTNEEVTVAHTKIRERLKRELSVTLRE
jgi:phenylalanyl-tRNA synthetase beta chain